MRPIVSQAGRRRLLWQRDHSPRLSSRITAAELDQARRRQHLCVSACQAFAYLSGETQVLPEHLEMAQHILWDDPTEQPQKCAAIIARIANPVGMRINSLLLECESIVAGCQPSDLAQAATAAAKLAELERTLASQPHGTATGRVGVATRSRGAGPQWSIAGSGSGRTRRRRFPRQCLSARSATAAGLRGCREA